MLEIPLYILTSLTRTRASKGVFPLIDFRKSNTKKEMCVNVNINFTNKAQLTDGNLIFGSYSKEKKNSKNISNIIINFKDDERLKYLNVILRDFLNDEKCDEIINLNTYKGNF